MDLNRNWDAHWQASSESGGADANPGSAPFSEPETRILKRLVDTLRPDVFITVHSGTLGMYMPYAYSRDLPNNDPTDLDRMTRILNALNPTYCRCPSGPAGKDVGYLCPGTCLDYAYEHHASISFAFEIYAPDADKIHADFEAGKEASPDWDGQARGTGLLEQTSSPSSLAASASFPPRFSSFLQSAQASSARLEAEQLHGLTARSREDCFKFFNPSSQEEYDETTSMWSEAFLKMIDMSAESKPRSRSGIGSTDLPVSVSTTRDALTTARKLTEGKRFSAGNDKDSGAALIAMESCVQNATKGDQGSDCASAAAFIKRRAAEQRLVGYRCNEEHVRRDYWHKQR